MAGASLLALMDDIASVLDDVALLTKVAAKKTAGVLGDDLALNAQQVSDLRADRELPVVWAVAKGSFRNKLILVPVALAISAFAPWAVMPLLMVGGAWLCFEGVEKVVHSLRQRTTGAHPASEGAPLNSDEQALDPAAFEATRIRGAIRTDFVLSAEIVTITLGTVADAAFGTRLAVLSGVAVLMTVGVYGVVAGIVKLDDGGLHLAWRPGHGAAPRFLRRLGRGILAFAPWMMKGLSVVGTAAMFLVGGGILTHGVPAVSHAVEGWAEQVAAVPAVGSLLESLVPALVNVAAGGLVGAAVLGSVALGRRVLRAVRRKG
jgi:predicted DNA repair protein MutK